MSMKTIARGLVVACCAALGLTALAEAPTPVVVFNGDLINGAHKNGKFEVSKRAEDSQVSIANGFASLTKTQGTGAPQGVKIAWDEATMPEKTLTVLVKYSGFDKNSGRTALLGVEWGGYDVSVSHSWDKKFNAGYYTHGSVGNNAGTERTASAAYDIPASGIMMVAMNSQATPDTTAGTRVAFYDATTSALVEKWRDSGLRWSDSTFKNILIGGTLGPQNHYYRPTMTVEAVAIFDKALTIEEANEYVFPTLHRITDVSGEVSWNELMEGRNFVDGDDVAIVMSGSSTITLPETPVLPGSFSVFGTGDMTIPAMNFPVVSGTQVIWARSFSGEALTKEGTNRLRIQNGDDNGSAETYEDIALDGTTVNIIDGTVELCNGHNSDARFNNATFNIGTYGDLDCYGWIYGKGAMTIENATDKTIFTNRGGNNGNLKDVPNIVKKGEGKLTMTCNLNSSDAITSTIDIQAGTLCLKNGNNKTLNGAITGAGNLEIDVGTNQSVKLGSSANTMASIIVTSGELDVAGKKPSSGYTVIANGGTIKSSGSHIYANENSIASLTLNANTSLTGGWRFGLTRADGSATSLALNDNATLNVAIGTRNDCINFRNTTVTGAGTIAVANNSFMLVYGSNGESMVANEAKLTMTSTAKLELNTSGKLTVKDFEAADGASIIVGNAAQGTLKVLGTYKNTNTIQKLELADGATIDVAAIPENGVVASASQTLTIGDISTIKLAINGEETTDYTLTLGENNKSVVATPVKTAAELFLEAINGDATEVTLAGDVAIESMITLEKSFAINLDGHTLSFAGDTAKTKNLIQVVNEATLTINGTTAGSKVIGRLNAGKAKNNNGSITLNGGTYEVGEGQTVLHVNGECKASNVTITNATIISDNDNGIQLNGAGTHTITGSTITGATAVYVKGGDVTIDGNTTLTATGTHVDITLNNNGSNPTGDAIVFEAAETAYQAIGEISIADTVKLESTNGSAVLSFARDNNTRRTGFLPAALKSNITEAVATAADLFDDYVEPSTDLPGAEEVPATQKDAYNEWAAANGVTESTTTDTKVLATAFAMGVTIGEYSSIEAAAKQAVENEVPAIDMAELVDGDLNAAVAAIQAKYPNAKVTLKDVTSEVSGATSDNTHLYTLVIELKK